MFIEKRIYKDNISFFINMILFPIKMLVPQPIIAKIPILMTNYEVRTKIVLKFIKGSLLDIGCGLNNLVIDYRKMGGYGIGVDVYDWGNIDILVNDTSMLPIENETIDTITFVASLNHIPNRLEVLKEANRVLKNDGTVIVTMLAPTISKLWHMYAVWDDDLHVRGMKEGEVFGINKKAIIHLFNSAGFKIKEIHKFSMFFNNIYIIEKEKNG